MWMREALAALALALMLLCPGLQPSCGGAQPQGAGCPPPSAPRQPPTDGDWEVGSGQYYSSQTIQLRGNLTILSGGSLTLQSVKLILSPAHDGQLRIEVRSGGSLQLLDGDSSPGTKEDATVISSATGYGYALQVLAGGRLVMKNSIVKGCGWEMGSRGESGGVYLRSQDCSIEGCDFVEGYCGLVVDNCAPRVVNSTFYKNKVTGMYARDSTLGLEGNTFEQNGRNGLELYCCQATVSGNIFRNNLFDGVLARNSSLLSEGNIYQLNNHQGLETEGSAASSRGDGFYENEVGAYFLSSSFELEGGLFESNRYGVYCRDGAGELRNTTLSRSSRFDLYLDTFSRSSEVVSFNSTFTSVGFGDAASALIVRWTLRLRVV